MQKNKKKPLNAKYKLEISFEVGHITISSEFGAH
jgi:hypothetical protein